MAEVFSSRSGRVVLVKGNFKQVVLANLTGTDKLIYRIFNGGKDGTAVQLFNAVPAVGVNAIHSLQWKDSVDVSLGKKGLWIKAGANDAEIVYELVGTV